MPVSHAAVTSPAPASADEQVPGLLEVLAQVPDPRMRRGRRFGLVFVLAVAVVCVLAGAKGFREIGDQAADLPQELLAVLGGRPHVLRRRIIAPSEKRIRTLLQALDAALLDEVTGTWLRALAAAGRLDGLLTAIEITQVRELLDPVDLTGAVVTADAAHAQHDTAQYIGGEREADYLLTVKGNQPGLQQVIYGKITADCGTDPDHVTMDYGHGRIIRRSIWVTGADGIDFPHAAQVLRIRRDTYDLDGTALAKEIVHGITSLNPSRGTPAALADLTRGQWGIESVHWLRDTAWTEDANTGYAGNGPQVMATLRNIGISLLHLAGITEITRTLQAISRDRNRVLRVLPL